MFSTKTLVAAFSVLSLAGTSFARPSFQTRRDAQYSPVAVINLIDATEHNYPVVVRGYGYREPTDVEQSISHAAINNLGSEDCQLYGIDGLVIDSPAGTYQYLDVGPPQVIVSVQCGGF